MTDSVESRLARAEVRLSNADRRFDEVRDAANVMSASVDRLTDMMRESQVQQVILVTKLSAMTRLIWMLAGAVVSIGATIIVEGLT